MVDQEEVEAGGQVWQLGRQIGSGGFGKVRVGESADGETVAVKFVPKAPGAERELLLVDLTGIKNVVPVLAIGETDESWVLVLPLADLSLREYLAQSGRLELTEALVVLSEVAEALAGLAAAGVVHRDLKPENVLRLDGAWCVADFGISRYAEATTAPDTRKYSMTYAYAAPEQWRAIRATAATDVYAYAVMAHEILNGERPFLGPGADDYREQHLHSSPPVLEGLGAALAALIAECLYKESGARPTAANIAARLAKITSAPATSGLARLQQANRDEVVRLTEEGRRRSQAEAESERRDGLTSAARQSLKLIGDEVRQTILAAATAASTGSARNGGWSLRLGDAELKFGDLAPAPGGALHAYGVRLGIDVAAFSLITVKLREPNRSGYQGRAHSLWFCNAQDAGQYQWFELAFMQTPLVRGYIPPINPFTMGPDSDAAEALSTTVTVRQLAWPFTPLVPGDLDEFIGRWAEWLALAANRQLEQPSTMPERPTAGSYRRA